MQRADARTHGSAELTLQAAEAANPEWSPWLRLLRRAREDAVAPWPLDLGIAGERERDAPLLHGAVVAVDEARARSLIGELFRMAAEDGEDRDAFGDTDQLVAGALPLLEAAIELSAPRLDRIALAAGADPGRVAAVMQLAAMPLLLHCRRRAAAHLPRGWTLGYCALCGAWPAFAETRGLERERRARCGRCAGEWRFDVLRCPYCDERDHAQLVGLVIEGDETRRIDSCRTCNGYLKSIATLMAVPEDQVALRDLETVELDLAASERGLQRPADRGFALRVEVLPREGRAGNDDGRSWLLS